MDSVIALDWETSAAPAIMPWHEDSFVVNLCVYDGTTTKVWWFNHNEVDVTPKDVQRNIDEIQEVIAGADVIVAHNMKFDALWLMRVGIKGLFDKSWYCTQIGDYLINSQDNRKSYSLDACCERHGLPLKVELVKKYWDEGYNTDEIPLAVLTEYVEGDARNAYDLYQKQQPLIEKSGKCKIVDLQMDLIPILTKAEYNGMLFDSAKAKELTDEYQVKMAGIDTELTDLFGFDINLASGNELSAGLFGGIVKREGREETRRVLKSGEIKVGSRKCFIEHNIKGLGFKPVDGTETKNSIKARLKEPDRPGVYKVSKDLLPLLKCRTVKQKRVVELIGMRSKMAQQLSTFFIGLQERVQPDGCVHGRFNMAVTVTGRLSSADPNLQNFPRGGTAPAKKLFVPRYDYIVNADLGQIEWRMAAYLSQDPVMIQEIKDGVDIHTANAIAFFGSADSRQDCKVFNFRMIYGGSAYSFFMDNSMPDYSLNEWEDIVDKFYKKYKKLGKWQDGNFKEVQRTGKLNVDATGRSFVFYKSSTNPNKPPVYRRPQVCNFPVQSTATADCMSLTMVEIELDKQLYDLKSLLIAQVHDSIVNDVPDNEVEVLTELCLNVFDTLAERFSDYFGVDFNVPLTGDVEIGKKSYGDMVVKVDSTTVKFNDREIPRHNGWFAVVKRELGW